MLQASNWNDEPFFIPHLIQYFFKGSSNEHLTLQTQNHAKNYELYRITATGSVTRSDLDEIEIATNVLYVLYPINVYF